MIRLIVFDVDSTLVESYTLNLLPGVREFFQLASSRSCQAVSDPSPGARDLALAIATNQGGVGMRCWMEQEHFGHPERYPDEAEVTQRMDSLVAELGGKIKIPVYISFRYQDRRGKWSPVPPEKTGDPRWAEDWRKPGAGMLIKAMADAGVAAGQTLFVGDSAEDQNAAIAAGCAFQWACDFFARDWANCKTLKEILSEPGRAT